MPKSTAIKASEKTIDTIVNELPYETNEQFVKTAIEDARKDGTSVFFVTNVMFMDSLYPFMVYGQENFLNDFASVPPGIEEHFVPVTQIKT